MTIDTKMQTILNYTLGKYLVGGSFLGTSDFSIMKTKIPTREVGGSNIVGTKKHLNQGQICIISM